MSHASVWTSSSWKLESSHTIHEPSAAVSAASVSARPTLPATSTGRAAERRIAPSSSVVVVFPFVPVTPIRREPAGSSR